MDAIAHFSRCPRCGQATAGGQPHRGDGPFRCQACGFVLFFSPVGAVAAILTRDDGLALFIRRAKEPARGKLGMPGGFVDPGERAEEALTRELREEVGLEPVALEYLTSHPNRYLYEGVTYNTIDLFFVARAANPERASARDAVDGIAWLDPLTVDPVSIAFDSMRAALRVYAERHGGWRNYQRNLSRRT